MQLDHRPKDRAHCRQGIAPSLAAEVGVWNRVLAGQIANEHNLAYSPTHWRKLGPANYVLHLMAQGAHWRVALVTNVEPPVVKSGPPLPCPGHIDDWR